MAATGITRFVTRGLSPGTTLRRFPRQGKVAAIALLVALALVVSLAGSAKAVNGLAGVYTYHYDLQRTGEDLQETALTPSTVNTTDFGKVASFPTDGRTYAQPLYVQNLDMGALGTHDVVFVVTEHDSVYAFDADGNSTTPLWKRSFIDSNPVSPNVRPVPAADTGDDEVDDIPGEIGITSTPVIDPATDTMYVVAATKEGPNSSPTYFLRLHAIDIRTGLDRATAPSKVINASVPGTGNGSSSGTLNLNTLLENQRAALLLYNGTLYLGFSSHGDHEPFHGWLLGYSASTLAQTTVFASTPNGDDGGIWMDGDGPAVDSNGNLFVITGDGLFDANTGGSDYGDTVLRLDSSGNVADYFSPSVESTLDADNLDLGAGGLLMLPDQSGAHQHELVTAGKNGTIYLIDRDNMGHYDPNGDHDVQTLPNVFAKGPGITGDNFSAPVYFNGSVYFAPVNDPVQAFSLTNGLLSTTPTSKTAVTFGGDLDRGSALAISANGADDPNGILWAVQTNGPSSPGVLHAYLASNLNTELWNSNQAGSRDTLGAWEKFSPPVIANGEVFVGGVNQLTVYGLLQNSGGGGGGGGGGGSGSGTADLSLSWSAKFPQVTTSGLNDLTATITNKGTASSTQTHFHFNLPASVQLVGPPYYELGSGCTGTTEVDCFLDTLESGASTRVVFEVRALTAGTVDIPGSVTDAQDANAADNASAVSFSVQAPSSPPPLPLQPEKIKVASVRIVSLDHARYVVVRIDSSTKIARIHVVLLNKDKHAVSSSLTRYVATNKAVRVGNLRLVKSVAGVKITV